MLFNLFKSKPVLKELIPDGFVDIHSHILPGIDDGAKDVKDSIEILGKLKNLGFSKIIGTPHTYPGVYDNSNETIKKSYDKLQNTIDTNIEIHFASEYLADNYLKEMSKNKELLTLKSNYLLIEFSYLLKQKYIFEIIFDLIISGYKPVLAHPERYPYFDKKDFFKLKKHGCLFQANLLSLSNYYHAKFINDNIKFLLKNDLINFIATDFHKISQVQYVMTKKTHLNNSNTRKIEDIFQNTISVFK